MSFRLLLENEPIVVVEIREALSDEDLTALNDLCTREMRRQCANNIRTVVILEISRVQFMSHRQRRIVGEWRAEVRELTRQVSAGMVMVVTSPLLRSVLTSINWFQREPIPLAFLKSFDEAVKWAIARCETAGVEVAFPIRERLLTQVDPNV